MKVHTFTKDVLAWRMGDGAVPEITIGAQIARFDLPPDDLRSLAVLLLLAAEQQEERAGEIAEILIARALKQHGGRRGN